jgi:3-dehydroquinate dehydratase
MRMPLRVMQRRFNPRGLWARAPGYGGGAGFRSPKFYGAFKISGITRDSTGAALASCAVHLFESATDIEIAQTVSDAIGQYQIVIGNNAGFFYIVAYKSGSPDVAGTTVNTLVAVPA